MKTLRLLCCTLALLADVNTMGFAEYYNDGSSWYRFGDWYPTTQRPYSDINNFLMLEGPGNENPGNGLALAQGDTNLRIPAGLKQYIVRQFRYILFDQASFADRGVVPWGTELRMMTSVYHEEAQALMALDPTSTMIVFPYFAFTTIHPAHPWYSAVREHESWFLHKAGMPEDSVNRFIVPDPKFFVMDVRNVAWRSFFVQWVDSIVGLYNYRGVFLDNMTKYPWINPEDFPSLPDGCYEAWDDSLIVFLNNLRAVLPPIPVVVSSLGFDDGRIPAVFGSSYGIEMVQHASGGALMESFHRGSTLSDLNTILGIMNSIRDMNKIFIGATHYGRDYDTDLSQAFGLEPTFPWVSPPQGQDPYYPPLSTFYRMAMSYLARYLLITPNAGSPPFGWSFQPGTMLYQFIPYYKPWDERIGTPVRPYVDTLNTYWREFTNALVIVNKTDATNPVSIPAGEWYWYPYPNWNDSSGNNLHDERYTPNVVVLNKMEGTVLFKKVTVDHKLEDGSNSHR